MTRLGRAGLAGLALFLGGPAVGQASDPSPPSEYEVKAAFLYNFARFVEWPEGRDGGEEETFVIAVLGEDPFGPLLDEMLRGKSVGGRAMTVRRAARPEEVGPCRILFISDSEKDRLSAILKKLGDDAVLTVGDMERFAEQGGVIRFRSEQSRVRLEINVAVAERSRLRISSELLKLARVVGKAGG